MVKYYYTYGDRAFGVFGGTMKSTNKMLCLVNLPNGTTFGIQCDPKAIGQKCLEEVSDLPIFYILVTQSHVPFILTDRLQRENIFKLSFQYILSSFESHCKQKAIKLTNRVNHLRKTQS